MGGCLSIERKGVAKEVRDLNAEIERLRVTSHEKDILLLEKDLELARTSAAIRDLVRGQEERDKKVRARDATLLEKDDAIVKEKVAYLDLLKIFGRLERRAALTGRVVRLGVSQLPLDSTTKTLCAFQRRVSISYVRSETVFAVISILVCPQPRDPSPRPSPPLKVRRRKASLAPDDEKEDDSTGERINGSQGVDNDCRYGFVDQTFVFFPAGCISAPCSTTSGGESGDVASLRAVGVPKPCVGNTIFANNSAPVKANKQLHVLPLLDVPPPQAPSRSGSGVGAGLTGVPVGGKKLLSTPRAGGATVSTPRHRYGSSHVNTPAVGCSPQPQQQQNRNSTCNTNRPSSVSLGGVSAVTREASMRAATAPYYVPTNGVNDNNGVPLSDFSRCLIEWSIVSGRSDDYEDKTRDDEDELIAKSNTTKSNTESGQYHHAPPSAVHDSPLPSSSVSVTHSIAVGFTCLHTAKEREQRRTHRKGQLKRSEKKAGRRRSATNAPFGDDDHDGKTVERGAPRCYDANIGGLNIGESDLSSSRSSSSASSATSSSSSSSAACDSSTTSAIGEARISDQKKIIHGKQGNEGGQTHSANKSSSSSSSPYNSSSPLALCSTGKSAAFNSTETTQYKDECAHSSSQQQPRRPVHDSKRSFTIVYSIEESSGKESWWLSMAGQKVCDLSAFFTTSNTANVRVAALLDLRPHRADAFSDEVNANHQGFFVGSGEGGVGIVKKREANAVSTNVSNPNTIKPLVHLINTPRHHLQQQQQHYSLPQTAASLSALPTLIVNNGGGAAAAAYRTASRGGTASAEPETNSTEKKSGATRDFGSGPYLSLPAPPHSPPKRSASLNALQHLRSQQQPSQGKDRATVNNRLGPLALRDGGPSPTIRGGIGERVGTCSSEESCSPLAVSVPPLPLFPMLRENTANPSASVGGGVSVVEAKGVHTGILQRRQLLDEDVCFGEGMLKVFLGIPTSSFVDEERSGSQCSPKAAASGALPMLRSDEDDDDEHVEEPADKNRLWKKKLVKGGVTQRASGAEVPKENEHVDPSRTTCSNDTPSTHTFRDAAAIALPYEEDRVLALKYERIGVELDGSFLFKVPTTRRARHKEITGKMGNERGGGDKKEERPLHLEGFSSKNIQQQISIATAAAVPAGGTDVLVRKSPVPAGATGSTAVPPSSVTVGTVSASHLMRHTTAALSSNINTSSACWGPEGGEAGGGAPPFSFGSTTPRTGAGGRKRPNSRGGPAGGEKTLLMVKQEADAAAADAATALLEEKERGEKERAAQRGGTYSAATFGAEPIGLVHVQQRLLDDDGVVRSRLKRVPLSYCPIVSLETRTSCCPANVGFPCNEVANVKWKQEKERKTAFSIVLHRVLFDDDIPEEFLH